MEDQSGSVRKLIPPGQLLKRHLITGIIKEHEKGNVYTALRFRYLFKRVPVVIKEANGSLPPDYFGRTMRDKLHWQKDIQQYVSKKVSVPKVKGYFNDNGSSYLVLQYIEGITLTKYLHTVFKNRIWYDLTSEERSSILKIIFQLVNELEKLHDLGYVHRDITPENLLITPKGKLYILDFELAYAIIPDYPSPPFSLGTMGFMPPEQVQRLRPTVAEDIYAFGNILLTALTNYPPLKFDQQRSYCIDKALQLFGLNRRLVNIISGCLQEDKNDRLLLSEIRVMLDEIILDGDSTEDNQNVKEQIKPNYSDVEHMITSYFRLLISKHFNETIDPYNTDADTGLAHSLHSILYVISVYGRDNMLGTALSYFKKLIRKRPGSVYMGYSERQPGLFCGDAGYAMVQCCEHQLGFIEIRKPLPQSYLRLRNIADCLDLANGVAGQALATLILLQQPGNELLEKYFKVMLQTILDQQVADGSWPLDELRLADGIAGILHFLLKYNHLRPDESVIEPIWNGLDFLMQKYKQQQTTESDNTTADFSLIGGSTGIALVFLQAYEQYMNPEYLELAEDILSRINPKPGNYDFSLESGLAGLGLVYVEAARITRNIIWEERAVWIYHLFEAVRIENKDYNRYWNPKGLTVHDIGLFSGNAGILYFLIKLQSYLDPDNPSIAAFTIF